MKRNRETIERDIVLTQHRGPDRFRTAGGPSRSLRYGTLPARRCLRYVSHDSRRLTPESVRALLFPLGSVGAGRRTA